MFNHTGGATIHGFKAMRMLPGCHRTISLGIGKTVERVYLRMDGDPADREGAKPQGKLGPGSFRQGLHLVQLDIDRWRRQVFKCFGSTVKVGDGGKRGGY